MKRYFAMTAIIILMTLVMNPISAKASSEDDVLDYINEIRQAEGLDAVTMDEDLQAVAAVRAEECATRFSHIRPNGKAWYTVSSLTNGENLAHAINYNQQKPENVVYAWMLSPKHCANVLRESFSTVGIAYYCDGSGDTFIVCEFR